MNYYLSVLKNYAVFTGRARRSEYWYFLLFNTIIHVGLAISDLYSHLPLGTIYNLAVLIPSIGVCIRRMHDVGKSGWYSLIPIYNLVLLCTDSDPGDNEYGPNPKEEAISYNEALDSTVK